MLDVGFFVFIFIFVFVFVQIPAPCSLYSMDGLFVFLLKPTCSSPTALPPRRGFPSP